MVWRHPSYWKALRKQRRDFEASERAQAEKRASEQADKRASKGYERFASKQEIIWPQSSWATGGTSL